jgi:hypothetical protein
MKHNIQYLGKWKNEDVYISTPERKSTADKVYLGKLYISPVEYIDLDRIQNSRLQKMMPAPFCKTTFSDWKPFVIFAFACREVKTVQKV